MVRLKIELNPVYFIVTLYDRSLTTIIEYLVKDQTSFRFEWHKGYRKLIRVPDKQFCIVHEKEGIYRFPNSLLKLFLGYLGARGRVNKEAIEFIDNSKIETGVLTKFSFKYDKFIPRDYQEQYIEKLCEKPIDIKLVDLDTGMGKTMIGSYAIGKISKKVAIVVLSRFMDKWLGDIEKYFYNTKDRVLVIQGSNTLIKMMQDPEYYKENYDFFVFSLTTVSNYIGDFADKDMDNYIDSIYIIPPDQLMQKLGIGVLLNDETHLSFHAVFRMLMYFRVDKVIGLTATLISSDKRTQAIYNTLFPFYNKISNLVEVKKYIDVYAIKYYIDKPFKVKHQTHQGYSHIIYETWILANSYFLKQYDDMILKQVEDFYIKKRNKKDKLLIYFTLVDMCRHFKKVLKRAYPKLKINTYTQEDDYESIMTSDISITTPGSAGVGLDIPNLITVINTIPQGTASGNRQLTGRLRDLKNKQMDYIYLYAGNLDKHRNLNRQREEAIKHKAKTYTYSVYRPSYLQEQLRIK